MMMDTGNLLEETAAHEDLKHQILVNAERWGHTDSVTMLPVLVEEIGEIANAYLNRDFDNMRVELLQAAAVLVQWVINLDTCPVCSQELICPLREIKPA